MAGLLQPSSLMALVIAAGSAVLPAVARAEVVTITGCPERGIAPGCVIMGGDGFVYDISSASPKPTVGVPGRAMGTVTLGDSACGHGKIMSAATWEPVPGIVCTDPSRG